MNDAGPHPDLLEKLPARTAAAWSVVPLKVDGPLLSIGVAGSPGPELAGNLETLFQSDVQLQEIGRDAFDRRFTEVYGVGGSDVDALLPPEPSSEPAAPSRDDSAIARFVDHLIRRAQGDRATDIHIEPDDSELIIRFRIDGILHPVPMPAALRDHRARLISRIKVMAGMDIAERRLPQDGRIRLTRIVTGQENGELDIRVSTVPTIHGETVDLRLLPRTRSVLGLDQLGMSADIEAAIAALIARPNGILLVTGPTGHGKSTTLYACLSRLNTPDRKIIAIEDPVEYRLRGVTQIQVHPKIGLTFASALRSVLRQDPDILMIGEIRDADTAEIAIRSSLTGHLVFSTLHTNDAVDAVTRLLDMGIEPYLVGSSVNAVLGQRLVRTRCANCRGAGCDACRGTGLRGRTGIFELLVLNEELRAMVAARSTAADIRRRALAMGMRTLFADGRRQAEAGVTTLEEVTRMAEAVA